MNVVSTLRRLAGKSPAYIIRRGYREIGRVVNGGRLNRRLKSLTIHDVLSATGHSTAAALIAAHRQRAFLLSDADRQSLPAIYLHRFPEAKQRLDAHVSRILKHEFDLLGSGPVALGDDIDWHSDFKTGFAWPRTRSTLLDYAQLDKPCDVKVPWELSRFQHLTALGRKWVLDRDERCVRELEAEVSSWIDSNPPGTGVNWACTMDVALRAVSWVWALMLFADAPLDNAFLDRIVVSLYQHGMWIPANLEASDINGNHFISDALGLVACGAFFRDGAEGKKWLAMGGELLEREILLQVDDDGVDIEASVQYHRLVLEIFLTGAILMRATGRNESAAYRERLSAMIDYVYAYVTPDGLSPVVGDADDGRAINFGEEPIRDHRDLLSTGAVLYSRGDWKNRSGQLHEGTVWMLGSKAADLYDAIAPIDEEKPAAFTDAGVFIFRSAHHYLYVDAGPVGFRGRGGHGHNDCLSFEWHVGTTPLITDSGAYVYTAAPDWRNRFRSTAFHNTIRVDREEINRFPDSLSLWSLRDDARPAGVSFSTGAEPYVAAAHTGYERLPAPVRVSRRFDFIPERPAVTIRDGIDGKGRHLLEFFFHLAPGIGTMLDEQVIRIIAGEQRFRIRCDRPGIRFEQTKGWFSPSYGVKVERPVWVASIETEVPFGVTWVLEADR